MPQRPVTFLKNVSLLLAVIFFAGCASLHKNPPLQKVEDPAGYSFNNILAQGNEIGDNLLVLTFSGGGTRAGALAYGVAKHMESIKLSSGKSLLDETKIISSVSGGSFASAYYGVYGKEKFLTDYPKDVLYQNLASQLTHNLLRVVRWIPILFSADLGRSDLSQALYDKEIYKNHTFKDLPRKWPFIVINSTDMTRGTNFPFIQENFDLLCSDLNSVKISRAVVSSSAFPGPFTPLTFKNYPKTQCGYQTPAWAEKALREHPEKNLEFYVWAQNVAAYTDDSKRSYIHLFDGGISDNLGLTPLLYYLRTGGWNLLTPEKKINAKRLILIVVDAMPSDSEAADKKPAIPKLMSVMMNAATKPMRNYTVKTAQEFISRLQENRNTGINYEKYQKLCDQVHASEEERSKCYDEFIAPYGGRVRPPYPDSYLVHVQFNTIPDSVFRDKVSHIGTDLQLKKGEVDSLIEAGKVILDNSPEFQRLLQDLKVKP